MTKYYIFHNSDKEFRTKTSFKEWIISGLKEEYRPPYRYWHTARNRRLQRGDITIFSYGSSDLDLTWLVGEAKVDNYRDLEGIIAPTAETNRKQRYYGEYKLKPESIKIFNSEIELTPELLKRDFHNIWSTMRKVGHKKKAGFVLRIGHEIKESEYNIIQQLSKQAHQDWYSN